MREIKFRYWNTTNNMMVCDPVVPTRKTEEWSLEQYFSDRGWVWQQFTGLKDKNGKEIYEGDVVVHVEDVIVETIEGHHRYEPEGSIGTVQFDNGMFYINGGEGEFYSYGEQQFVWSELEVIGNIYENPELIEK